VDFCAEHPEQGEALRPAEFIDPFPENPERFEHGKTKRDARTGQDAYEANTGTVERKLQISIKGEQQT
jgi:hypothetical protein